MLLLLLLIFFINSSGVCVHVCASVCVITIGWKRTNESIKDIHHIKWYNIVENQFWFWEGHYLKIDLFLGFRGDFFICRQHIYTTSIHMICYWIYNSPNHKYSHLLLNIMKVRESVLAVWTSEFIIKYLSDITVIVSGFEWYRRVVLNDK